MSHLTKKTPGRRLAANEAADVFNAIDFDGEPDFDSHKVVKPLYLRVRVSDLQDKIFKAAANRAGISVSAWVIERLLRCAREEKND